MEKRAYTTPVMHEECFMADEYIAACWDVACARAGSDDYAEPSVGGKEVTHASNADGKGCGHAENQIITENADGTVSMTEVNVPNQGTLPCVMTDSSWNPVSLNAGDVKTGDTIYWVTNANDGSARTWHHYGTAQVYGNHS